MDLKALADKVRIIFITGNLGEGKTAVSYHIIDKLKKNRDVYVFKHRKPELILKLGYKVLYEIDEIENINKAILWIDEPDIIFPRYEKRGSIILTKILSLCRQKDLILMLSTSNTRYITSNEEFYIDTYIIKKIDYSMIKRGSKLKDILSNMSNITPEGFANNIKKNEFILWNKDNLEYNNKYIFELPEFWNDKYSKPFS